MRFLVLLCVLVGVGFGVVGCEDDDFNSDAASKTILQPDMAVTLPADLAGLDEGVD